MRRVGPVGRVGVVAALIAWTLAVPAWASGRAVTIVMPDGVELAAELYEASSRPAPGVVFVHMLTRNKGDWGRVADRLQDAGVTALTFDLRGHGRSSGVPDLAAMTGDLETVVRWLAARGGVNPGSIGIAGASLGANLAVLAAADLPEVRALALLSPSIDYRGLRADAGAIKRLGDRRLWLAAGTADPLAMRTMKDYIEAATGPREQHIVEGAVHGTALLDDGDTAKALVDWLRRSLLF